MRRHHFAGALMLASICISRPASAQGIEHPEITLDDSYILGVRARVDQEEIEAARWAMVHAATPAVRSFAQSLLRGHSNAQNSAEALAARLHVELKITGDTSNAIGWRETVAKASEEATTGRQRDRLFLLAVRNEHAAEIQKVNGWYGSIAADDSVKAYLHEIMPTLVKHEQAAERLLASNERSTTAH